MASTISEKLAADMIFSTLLINRFLVNEYNSERSCNICGNIKVEGHKLGG